MINWSSSRSYKVESIDYGFDRGEDEAPAAADVGKIRRFYMTFESAELEQQYRKVCNRRAVKPVLYMTVGVATLNAIIFVVSLVFGQGGQLAWFALLAVSVAASFGLVIRLSERIRSRMELCATVGGSSLILGIFFFVVASDTFESFIEAGLSKANQTAICSGLGSSSLYPWSASSFEVQMVIGTASMFLVGMMGILTVGLRFWHSVVTVPLPMLAIICYLTKLGTRHGMPPALLVDYTVRIVLPGVFTALITPYQLELRSRIAFASEQRVKELLNRTSVKAKKIQKEKEELERRFLPTTEEERRFEPYRRRIQDIICEGFIDASQLSTIRVLGQGAFGVVALAKWNIRGFAAPIEVATKALHPTKVRSTTLLDNLVKEVETLHNLEHRNIVGFFGVAWPQNAFPSILLEYCAGGSCEQLLHSTSQNPSQESCGSGTNDQARCLDRSAATSTGQSCLLSSISWTDPMLKIARDMCKGLQYLHALNVIHRDIKPANVLLTRTFGSKIGDLGEARNMVDQTMTCCGTPIYCAPEVMVEGKYDATCDIFSVGVILNEFDTRLTPYSQDGYFSVAQVVSGRRPVVKTQNPALLQLVNRCWHSDPAERPTISEVLGTLTKYGDGFDLQEEDCNCMWRGDGGDGEETSGRPRLRNRVSSSVAEVRHWLRECRH